MALGNRDINQNEELLAAFTLQGKWAHKYWHRNHGILLDLFYFLVSARHTHRAIKKKDAIGGSV